MLEVSVIIPISNVADHIDPLVSSLVSILPAREQAEILFVDDASTAAARAHIRAWMGAANVRLLTCEETSTDPAASVLTGCMAASGKTIVVMDADCMHCTGQIPRLVQPIAAGSHDLVIGNRYQTGRIKASAAWYRRLLSMGSSMLARAVCDVSDPTSGLFAFRGELIAQISNYAHGNKVLLELLLSADQPLRVHEIAIPSVHRRSVRTEQPLRSRLRYLQRLMVLTGGSVSLGSAGRFAMVGLAGLILDVALFQFMLWQGYPLATAHLSSFFAATILNYLLSSAWAFGDSNNGSTVRARDYSRFLAVALMAVFLRGGVLALLVEAWGVPSILAIFPAILATSLVNYLGSAFFVFPSTHNRSLTEVNWRVAAVGIVVFMVSLRLIYLGLPGLLPSEAHYWSFTQRVGFDQLAQPPMVVWLITFGTWLVGHSELGVRLGAFVSGLLALGFMFALSLRLYDTSVAMKGLLLMAILPFAFVPGLFMTPAAPLLACWTAALYCLYRALFDGNRNAWLGLGVVLGLGMLSHYTMALLIIGIAVLLLVETSLRPWLRKPQPYWAAVMAASLFSLALLGGTAPHSSALTSRLMQGLTPPYEFSIQLLLLHSIILLTPPCLLALLFVGRGDGASTYNEDLNARQQRFLAILTVAPLTLLAAFSLIHPPRLLWTAPIWVTVVPLIASVMTPLNKERSSGHNLLYRSWAPTIITLSLIFAGGLHYIVLGLPLVPDNGFKEYFFWKETAQSVVRLEEQLANKTGRQPIVIVTGHGSIANALAFYTAGGDIPNIHSINRLDEHLLQRDHDRPNHQGGQSDRNRPVIVVGTSQKVLHDPVLDAYLQTPGPIEETPVQREGQAVRQLYYRIAQGYSNPVDIKAERMTRQLGNNQAIR